MGLDVRWGLLYILTRSGQCRVRHKRACSLTVTLGFVTCKDQVYSGPQMYFLFIFLILSVQELPFWLILDLFLT